MRKPSLLPDGLSASAQPFGMEGAPAEPAPREEHYLLRGHVVHNPEHVVPFEWKVSWDQVAGARFDLNKAGREGMRAST